MTKYTVIIQLKETRSSSRDTGDQKPHGNTTKGNAIGVCNRVQERNGKAEKPSQNKCHTRGNTKGRSETERRPKGDKVEIVSS